MSNPQHLADQTIATRIKEHRAWAISTQTGTTPDRNGKHRAVEAFNPMTGITTAIKDATW